MLTKQDYQNLLALVSRAQFSGIGEAAAAVMLHQKLTLLVNEPAAEKVEALGDSSDSN